MSGIENSKLCVLLETFTSKEISLFYDFISSPFNNKNKIHTTIVKELLKIHPNYSEIDKKTLEKKTQSNNLVRDMSLVMKLAERFLVICHVKDNKLLSDFTKISELNKRALGKLTQGSIKSFKSGLQNTKIKSFNELLYNYLVDEEIDTAYNRDEALPYSQALLEKAESLDVFYVFNKLKIYTEMQMRERIMNVSYEKTFFDEIKTFIDDHPDLLEKHPSLQIYLMLIELLKEKVSRTQYVKYFSFIKEYISFTPTGEASNFIQHAINHCIKMTNTGHNYLPELFDAMKFQVEEGLLVVEGFVHDRSYKNIIEVALRVKEQDWAENFLETHIKFITNEDREMIYNCNKASILLFKKEYKAALRSLTFVNFKNVFYDMYSRSLMIKIYFETNDTISVETSVNNYKSFLKREKSLADIQRSMYQNFIKYASCLTRIKDKINSYSEEFVAGKLRTLQLEIQQEKYIADKIWLMKQVDELKNRII
jgi:hypothetical protein